MDDLLNAQVKEQLSKAAEQKLDTKKLEEI